MITGIEHGIDRVVTWGDPWHGLLTGSVLNLPGGLTRPANGAQPLGGDCFIVQKPGQPAVATSQADSDLGMTWLNYGLMAGRNHCIYGHALGENAWIYIDDDGDPWLARLVFDIGSRSGSIDFRRFGLFPDDGNGVVQTAVFGLAGPFNGSQWQIDDILPVGSGALIVTHEPNDFWPSESGMVTPGYRDVGGAFELTISGIPPAAAVTANQLANASQALGTSIDTRAIASSTIATVNIHVSNVGRHGQLDRLHGYCYAGGVATPVLRSFWTDQESHSTPTAVPNTTFIDYTVNGTADYTYQIKIDAQTITLTGHEQWSGYGRIDYQYQTPSHISGHKTFTSSLAGFGGFSFTFDGDTTVSYQANDGLLFTDAGDTDNYLIPTGDGLSPTVAIWPARLANGLFGLCRATFNFNNYVFSGINISAVVSPYEVTTAEFSSTDDGSAARATRHPETGLVVIEFDSTNLALCYR